MKLIGILKKFRQKLVKKYQKDENNFLIREKSGSNLISSFVWWDIFGLRIFFNLFFLFLNKFNILESLQYLILSFLSIKKRLLIFFSIDMTKALYSKNVFPRMAFCSNLGFLIIFLANLFLSKLILRIIGQAGNSLINMDNKNLKEKFFNFFIESKFFLLKFIIKLKAPFLKFINLAISFFKKLQKSRELTNFKSADNFNNFFLELERQIIDLEQNKFGKDEKVQFTNKFIENLFVNFLNLSNFIGIIIRRIILLSCYFFPLLSIGFSTLSLEDRISYAWSYNSIKFLSFFPFLCEFLFPILYSGLDLISSQGFTTLLFLGYFILAAKGKKYFGLPVDFCQNIALATVFLGLNSLIGVVKQFLAYIVEPFSFPFVILFLKGSRFLFFNFFLLILLTLIYNCIIFLATGKNPEIPILSASAKRYMEQG